MITQEQLGAKIKQIRKSKKITQEKLAETINVDFGYISKLEVGQNFPSIQTLNKIADTLNVDISEFFTYKDINEIDLKSETTKLINNFNYDELKIIYKVAKSIRAV
ncbi:helix-turn-helix transcriptional regulator [bacterium]|nr:helix-turn-helix transcriptional regulator [bacterium]